MNNSSIPTPDARRLRRLLLTPEALVAVFQDLADPGQRLRCLDAVPADLAVRNVRVVTAQGRLLITLLVVSATFDPVPPGGTPPEWPLRMQVEDLTEAAPHNAPPPTTTTAPDPREMEVEVMHDPTANYREQGNAAPAPQAQPALPGLPLEPPTAPPIPGLVIGRIVVYVLPARALRAGEERPAIIVRVWDIQAGYCNLQVFLDGDNDGAEAPESCWWRGSVPYDPSPDPAPGTWHFGH